MKYLGDYAEDATVDFKFSTHQSDGTPITLGGTPAISVYKANGTTESTAGVTLTVDFDSRTGCHHVRIDTSADAFYAVANDYQVVITTGTVDGTSVVGTVVATFSIENRFAEVDVTKISGDTTAADNLELAFDGTGYGFTGCTIPTVTTLTGHTAQTGDSFARLGAPAGASVSADIAAVKAETALVVADTNELQTDWADGGRLDVILDASGGTANLTTETTIVES